MLKLAAFGSAPFCPQLRRLGQMDEQVEVVAHEAIRRNLDAGKLRHAPQPLDEARTLLVSQVERAVCDPTDQVITTIRLEIAQSSHAAHYSIFRNYSTTPTPPFGSLWVPFESDKDFTLDARLRDLISLSYVNEIISQKDRQV